jgi:hypothetical protein
MAVEWAGEAEREPPTTTAVEWAGRGEGRHRVDPR